MNKAIGLDLWKCHYKPKNIFHIASNDHITIYDFYTIDQYAYFYTEIRQRNKVYNLYSNIQLMQTTGMLGFLLNKKKNLRFYMSLLTVIVYWFVLQQISFLYQIEGDEGDLKKKIINEVSQLPFPVYSLNTNDLYKTISDLYHNQLSWLEIYKEGSIVKIAFSQKKNVSIEELTREPLYATKDAVIVSFDVQHGSKKVKVNDFVAKGTMLVDAYMLDSYNQIKDLYVKGKVYGYTWYTITSLCTEENSLHDGIAFFRLLLDCRRQISLYLNKDEKIIKETVLQYRTDEGTIVLKVHYTLLEDITVP